MVTIVIGSSFDVVIVVGFASIDVCFGKVVVASVREGMKDASGTIIFSNDNNFANPQRHGCWPLQENTLNPAVGYRLASGVLDSVL